MIGHNPDAKQRHGFGDARALRNGRILRNRRPPVDPLKLGNVLRLLSHPILHRPLPIENLPWESSISSRYVLFSRFYVGEKISDDLTYITSIGWCFDWRECPQVVRLC